MSTLVAALERADFDDAVAVARQAPADSLVRFAVVGAYRSTFEEFELRAEDLQRRAMAEDPALGDFVHGLALWQGIARGQRRLVEQVASGAPSVERRTTAALWLRLLDEPSGRLADEASAHAGLCRDRGRGADVVLCTVLAALALDLVGETERGLATARRGNRMARAEGLTHAGVFSALVLARLRRRSGLPFLAAFILRELGPRAPRAWRSLVETELFFASGRCEHARVLALDEALVAGDPSASERAMDALAADLAPWSFLHRELAATRALLLGEASDDPSVRAWQVGDTAEIPLGLAGSSGALADARAPTAQVARAEGRGLRLLARGAPGLRARGFAPIRAGGRAGAVLSAALLMPEEGLETASLFHRAYGFDYVERRHHNTFSIALHRARGALPESMTLEVRAGRVILRGGARVLADDPRCHRGVEERVLSALAREPSQSAREAARAAGVGLRLCQQALAELTEAGACQVEKVGRRVVYRVEDTTYAPATTRVGVADLAITFGG